MVDCRSGDCAGIGLGICRFSYAWVLPDMRESLGWSYSTAGFMNTINAAGYVIGALSANAMVRRVGLFNTIRISAGACVFSLVLSSLTGNIAVFSIARLISGVAFAFVSGGALASNIAQAQQQRQAFYLSDNCCFWYRSDLRPNCHGRPAEIFSLIT
jgi:predicted MFS family arabinose efflux permease